ncbi:sensor histidine kinase [Glycomyces salinus]|uniref:sensor histidine kinase n=1 Tax=Glycomyces salinus TaxID=980294 RepID=UPI0018EA7C6B|nr:ATP-binding protein [Glycomyces salinus]
MPEPTRSSTHNHQYDGSAPTGLPASAAPAPDIGPRLRRLALLPAAATAVIGAGVALFASQVDISAEPSWMPAVVIGTAAVFIGLVAFLAFQAAGGIDADVSHRIGQAHRSTTEIHYRLLQAQEALKRGDTQPMRRRRAPAPAAIEAAAPAAIGGTRPETRVGIFVNRARRLQTLAHREIVELDEMERQVEDPALLKSLFSVDHLATRVRRHAENLAVLGGGPSHRLWSRPVNVYEALRSAVAEVEHYARVKLVRPIEGRIKGHAAADFIHLVAELIENATVFSAPETEVFIRVARVRTGLAVEVEDRGLGMVQEERDRYNRMFAEPVRIDLDELLADGRIGLYVVSSLADRHNLVVRLQSNIFGGTQAVVIIGEDLLGEGTPAPAEVEAPARRPAVEAPRPADPPPAAPDQRAPAPVGTGPQAAPPQPAPPVRPEPAAPQLPSVRLNGTAPASRPHPTAGARPPLPKRDKQTHLAPQLRDASGTPEPGSDAAHDPGLMQAFQRGRRRGEGRTDPALGPDSDTTPYEEEDA